MVRLRKNQIISTADGKTIKVLERIGEGGQGIVYKVLYDNKEYALKWYKKNPSKKFYDNLKENSDGCNCNHGHILCTIFYNLSIFCLHSKKHA